ncbi:hypothetical protein BGZ49_005182 [Haplosporangium sp. Z 27]|nr:hypothetical protein BGZ49_005182 [Haplosporangium sp. Z 27]
MLDNPEIDAIICKQLHPGDLARCSQVSKQWNRIVIPHLWKDISVISATEMFLYDLIGDFLHGHFEDHFSLTEKYSQWIQLIPPPFELFNNIMTNVIEIYRGSRTSLSDREHVAFSAMRQLLSQCSNVQVPYLDLDSNIYGNPDLLKFTLEYYLPLVQDLELHIARTRGHTTVPLAFKNIMNQMTCCSRKLKRLTLNSDEYDHSIGAQGVEDEAEDEAEDEVKVDKNGRKAKKLVSMIPDNNQDNERQAEEESSPTLQLNELVLDGYSDNLYQNNTWSWLWEQCGSVERLHVRRAFGSPEKIVNEVLTHMPNLCKIRLGIDINPSDASPYISDEYSAALISSGHRWKEIIIYDNVKFDEASRLALTAHYPTLQVLTVLNVDFTSKELVQLLSSASYLQKLNIDINDWEICENDPSITSSVFINQDPDSGLLKPWACEDSLEVLEVKIRRPRADLGEERSTDGINLDEGLDDQGRLYERLARLTNLKKLRLGGRFMMETDITTMSTNIAQLRRTA